MFKHAGFFLSRDIRKQNPIVNPVRERSFLTDGVYGRIKLPSSSVSPAPVLPAVFSNGVNNTAVAGRLGFTLIEALLATAIAGIIMVAVAGSFYAGVRVWKKAGSRSDSNARRIISRLAGELRSAYTLFDKDSVPWFKGGPASIQFVTVVSLKENFSEGKGYDLREVKYWVADNPGTGISSLLYGVNFNPGEEELRTDTGVVLNDRVKKIKFSYYDGDDWKETWDAGENPPAAVKVYLELQGRPDQPLADTYETVVDIMGYVVP